MFNSKLDELLKILKPLESAVLAYSGGVDSTFLLKALQLSGIKTLAVTASSETTPPNDLLTARKIAAELAMKHRVIKTNKLSREEFVNNTSERCYFCKDELFKQLSRIASAGGYRFILDGSNIDDMLDYRPGRKAATKYHVKSPLREAGLSKKEIRGLSRRLHLQTWDKTSSPCLFSRFPYGQRVTKNALKRVEKAEECLRKMGFHEVRVRDHNGVARIEVAEREIDLFLNHKKRKIISERLKSLGYTFVSLDLEGYRTGSMNRVLKENSGIQGVK